MNMQYDSTIYIFVRFWNMPQDVIPELSEDAWLKVPAIKVNMGDYFHFNVPHANLLQVSAIVVDEEGQIHRLNNTIIKDRKLEASQIDEIKDLAICIREYEAKTAQTWPYASMLSPTKAAERYRKFVGLNAMPGFNPMPDDSVYNAIVKQHKPAAPCNCGKKR